jgi:hypothetical protein
VNASDLAVAKQSGKREYVIRDDAGAAVTAAQAFGALPAINSTLQTPRNDIAACRSVELKAVEDSVGRVWTATVNFEWDPKIEGYLDFVAVETNTSVAFVDVWRIGAAWPNINSPGNGDIGGTKVDACGEPVSTTVYQTEIVVTNIKASDPSAAILNVLGRRNSVSFLGFTAGYVVFLGATQRRTEEGYFEVQYRFMYDGAAHLRQIPARDVDGQPLLDAPDANGNTTARHVMARQPFPNTSNFASALSLVL